MENTQKRINYLGMKNKINNGQEFFLRILENLSHKEINICFLTKYKESQRAACLLPDLAL